MKTAIPMMMATIILISCGNNNNGRQQAVEQVVTQFINAGDSRDAGKLKSLLHNDYRALVNRLFGSNDVRVIDKSAYLKLIEDGTIGGDQRTVNFQEVDIVQHNAYVKAEMLGNDFHFTSYFLLAEDTLGNWKILSDLPYLEPVQREE